MLISGHFRATYGSSIDLFAGLRTPIVERFEPADEFVNSMVSPVADTLSRIIHVAAEFI
jgi:AraC family transcriptional activator of mtrCDE